METKSTMAQTQRTIIVSLAICLSMGLLAFILIQLKPAGRLRLSTKSYVVFNCDAISMQADDRLDRCHDDRRCLGLRQVAGTPSLCTNLGRVGHLTLEQCARAAAQRTLSVKEEGQNVCFLVEEFRDKDDSVEPNDEWMKIGH